MKSMNLRRTVGSLFAVMLLGMFLTVVRPVSAEAETVTLTKKNFAMSYVGSTYVSFNLKLPFNNIQADIALYENTKLVGKTRAYSYGTINYKVKKNKTYFYRVRPVYQGKYIGKWSVRKAFSTIDLKLQQKYGGTRTLKVTVPKMVGVKSVTLQMSTSSDSGFKTWKTLKPGKSKSCRSINGKKFESYKTYYIRAKVKLKNGVSCDTVYSQSFHFYSRYQ